MNKFLVTTIGLVLVAGAVSAWAGQAERAQLEQCTADIVAHYGKGTRSRLSSVSRDDDGTTLRLLVRPAGGDNTPVVCVSAADGAVRLTDDDGVALVPEGDADEQQVTLAE